MKRYKVEIVYLRTETYTAYVWAKSEADAESQADEEIESSMDSGDQDTIEVKVEFELLNTEEPHKVVHGSSYEEERFNEQICLVCDKRIVWTGQEHDDPRNTTGKTIPGPWVHEDDWGAA